MRTPLLLIGLLHAIGCASAPPVSAPPPSIATATCPRPGDEAPIARSIRVTLAPSLGSSAGGDGRLIVFMRAADAGGVRDRIDLDFEAPRAVWMSGQEVDALHAGAAFELDVKADSFPAPLSSAPAGEYQIMAVLDPDHSYPVHGLDAGDLRGPVTRVTVGPTHHDPIELSLDHVIAAPTAAATVG